MWSLGKASELGGFEITSVQNAASLLIFTAVIWVIVIALFLYARAQVAKGLLR